MSDGSQTNPDAEDPLGISGITIDKRYQVLTLVDEGGHGYVYKAHHVMWDKPVAMKFFKRSSDNKRRESMKTAFIKEGALLSELSRKTTSIVQSRDVGEYDLPDGTSLLYTVLEWLEGSTLDHVLRDERAAGKGPWPMSRVIRTMSPVAEALRIAHDNGVAHRDIKPSNIFIVDEDGHEVIKVLDFGIAKVVAGLVENFKETSAGKSRAYTPAYASPEQFAKRHGATGPWTDVYALALVCVELLVGHHPMDADNFGQLVLAACDPELRPTPQANGRDLGADVETVFLQALAVTPEDRFASVGKFWKTLLATEEGRVAVIQLQQEGGDTGTLVSPSAQSIAPGATSSTRSTTQRSVSVTTAADEPRTARLLLGAFVAACCLAALVAYWTVGPGAASRSEGSAVPTASASSAPTPAVIDKDSLASFATLPTVVNSKTNPVTPKKVSLGRHLYYDKRLSQGGDLSCNSCHPLDKFGSDGEQFSVGNAGKRGRRNSLTVYHTAGAFALFWDGRAASLEEQAQMPVVNPDEMAMNEKQVVRLLRRIPGYVSAFREAFPGDGAITMKNVGRAIAAFERKLFTPGPWDDFLAGDKDALSESARRGFNAFISVGCVTCHFGPYIGLTMYQKLGLVRAWPDSKDSGRFEVTKNDADFMVFRVPSLRNIVETGPYFHDGSEPSLGNAVRRMALHQLGRKITDEQVKNIVAWLSSLTGRIPKDLIRKPTPYTK
ncbi:MAG: cytochrome c peroxidase [Polyangiaceae bacterium]